MKSQKKPTLADLETRLVQWCSSYIADHELLPLGQRVVITLQVAHHKTTHLYSSSQKIARADPVVSEEPMTERDWNIIMRLPLFRKPRANTVEEKYVEELKLMRDGEGPQKIPYAHANQISRVFAANGLLYHVFMVSGSTSSRYRGPAKFQVYKKL